MIDVLLAGQYTNHSQYDLNSWCNSKRRLSNTYVEPRRTTSILQNEDDCIQIPVIIKKVGKVD